MEENIRELTEEKKTEKKMMSLYDLWGNIKQSNIYVTGVPATETENNV